MTHALIWVSSLAVLAIVGAPLLFHSNLRSIGLGARIGLSAAVGAVVTSWVMTLMALVGLRWAPWNLLPLSMLTTVALRLLTRSRTVAPGAPPSRMGRDVWVWSGLVGGVVAVVAAALSVLGGKATSPDLLFFWGPKGEQFASTRTIDINFLKAQFHDYMHADYPPLVPNLYALATLLTGGFSWQGATLLFPILLGVTFMCVRGIFQSELPAVTSVPLAGLMTASLAVIGITTMFGGIAEMPLLFFEVLGIGLLCSVGRQVPAARLVAGLCLAGAVSTKVEGVAVVCPAVAAFVTAQPRGDRLKAALYSGVPALVVLTTWFLLGQSTHLFTGYAGYGPLTGIHWSRVPAVLKSLASNVGMIERGLPYLLPLFAFLLARGPIRQAATPLVGALGLLGFLAFTYLHGAADPQEWITWSAARVLSPIPALLAVAAACRLEPAARGPRLAQNDY